MATAGFGVAAMWAITQTDWSVGYVGLLLVGGVGVGLLLGAWLGSHKAARQNRPQVAGIAMFASALLGGSFLGMALTLAALGVMSLAVAVNAVLLYRSQG